MQKVLEYERQAAVSRQFAAETKDRQYKKELEDMAKLWERLARERRRGIVESEANSS